jgi:hypothetical protein
VPQVVRHTCQRRPVLDRAERQGAGLVPHAEVRRVTDGAAAWADEQPTVRRRPELAQVPSQDLDRRRMSVSALFVALSSACRVGPTAMQQRPLGRVEQGKRS